MSSSGRVRSSSSRLRPGELELVLPAARPRRHPIPKSCRAHTATPSSPTSLSTRIAAHQAVATPSRRSWSRNPLLQACSLERSATDSRQEPRSHLPPRHPVLPSQTSGPQPSSTSPFHSTSPRSPPSQQPRPSTHDSLRTRLPMAPQPESARTQGHSRQSSSSSSSEPSSTPAWEYVNGRLHPDDVYNPATSKAHLARTTKVGHVGRVRQADPPSSRPSVLTQQSVSRTPSFFWPSDASGDSNLWLTLL